MTSKIEQIIDDLELYIENCKFKPFSTDMIIVNKTEIDEMIRDLRMTTPEEIKRYQKMISNKEAILNDAKEKAQQLLNNAAVQTNELISEHQIMQQAYAQANEIVELATQQAQDILDRATMEANGMKSSVMQYADRMIANLEGIVSQSIELATNDYNKLVGDLQEIDKVVTANRADLVPPEVMEEGEETAEAGTPSNA
ncbi:MAG: vacuolar family H+-ATPase subunit H [Lachnospiraceae bacterium]|nr:vacuolar family H+-ATPase subunit H [Lachnospiraceae bacterium]